jgi:hypothetical protein
MEAVMMSELAAEVGTLADSVMITEGHRPPCPGAAPVDLADDVTDVLFMLVRLADHYEMDLSEADARMLTVTVEHLEQQMLLDEDDTLALLAPVHKEEGEFTSIRPGALTTYLGTYDHAS